MRSKQQEADRCVAIWKKSRRGCQVQRPCDGREQVSRGPGGSMWLGSGTPGTSKGDNAGETQRHNDTGLGGVGREFGVLSEDN